MNTKLTLALTGTVLAALGGLCLAFTVASWTMAGDSADAAGLLLWMLAASYAAVAFACFALCVERTRQTRWLAQVRTWWLVGAVAFLGFASALPVTIATGLSSSVLTVATFSFVAGVVPVTLALWADDRGHLPELAAAEPAGEQHDADDEEPAAEGEAA